MNFRITFIVGLYLLLNLDQTTAYIRTILDRVEPLAAAKESKMQWMYLRIAPSNNTYDQGEFHVLEDVDSNKLKIVVTVDKCLVGEAPDTCEFLVKLKPLNACMLLNAENMAWTNVTGAYTPKFNCPLKKGKYVGPEITFDANKWSMFPLDKFYFKVIFKLYEGNVLTLALLTHGHIVRIH